MLLFPWPGIFFYTPKQEKCGGGGRKSRSHFIYCRCTPMHISSLKHLDISVMEHFPHLWVKYASQSCLCAHPCACGGDKKEKKKKKGKGVHVCTCARAPALRTCLCGRVMYNLVNWNGARHRGAIDGSINWYRVSVMSSVRRRTSLFYRLHLQDCCLPPIYLFPPDAINIYWHSNEHFSIILCDFIITEAYSKHW